MGWSSAGRWLPGLPACRWILLRYVGKHGRQRSLGLVDPRPQEPPVPPGRQRLVLGVHGRDQLLEQAADPCGPVPPPVVGDLELAFESFPLAADPSQSLLTYTAEPGSPSQDALRLLASWAATTDDVGQPAGTDDVRRLGT